MCTRPIAPGAPVEESEGFRVGGVLMDSANRKILPAAILIAAELVAAHVLLLDDENDPSDWFASRFWEAANIIGSALRRFDPDDPSSFGR